MVNISSLSFISHALSPSHRIGAYHTLKIQILLILNFLNFSFFSNFKIPFLKFVNISELKIFCKSIMCLAKYV